MSKKYVSISIGEHVIAALEDFAKKNYQNNLSMSITQLIAKQLEALGYVIDYDNQTHNVMTKKNKETKKHIDTNNDSKN